MHTTEEHGRDKDLLGQSAGDHRGRRYEGLLLASCEREGDLRLHVDGNPRVVAFEA